MTPPETSALAVQLERMGADLGEIKTACAVLVERSQRTEQDVRDLRRDTDEEVRDLRADVEKLKRAMWLAMGACTALGGAAGAAARALGG